MRRARLEPRVQRVLRARLVLQGLLELLVLRARLVLQGLLARLELQARRALLVLRARLVQPLQARQE